MESWPTDFEADNHVLSKRRYGGKEIYRLIGQTLDVGSLGAATLATKDNSLEWKTLVQPPGKARPRQIGESVELLPFCRPPHPEVPDQQKAAEGIKFIRTNYPDVDMPLELLQEEIQADEKKLKEFDPYQGNQVAQLAFLDKKRRSLDFVASPVGETGSELNVFPILATSSASSYNFIPVSKPLIKFNTPIRQLATFPLLKIEETHSLLAVRNHGSISFLKISTNRADLADHPLDAMVVRSFSSAETNKHSAVDMECGGLSHTSGRLLVVNDAGGVFISDIDGPLQTIHSSVNDSELSDRFWRVAWRDINTYIRISTKEAQLFDLRAPATPPTELFHLTDFGECITSLETTPGESPLLGISTTSRLLLFDVRHMHEPVIVLNHYRTFDRSLRLKSVNMGDSVWHTLSSSQNRLVTAYNTASSFVGLVHLQGMHSILPSSPNVELPIIGSHIFKPASDPFGSHLSYIQLSSAGALWSTDVTFTERDSDTRFLNQVNNEAMEDLIEKSRAIPAQFLEGIETESTEVDLSDVYAKITRVKKKEENRDNFYQVLNELPSFWQDADTSVDHMLTTFDVAFRSGQEPNMSSHFFTGTALNNRRGLKALLKDRIPIAELSQRAPWSFDLASLSPELIPDGTVSPKELLDQLSEEAVAQETTKEGIKFATEAAQELVMDLALSRHVYAPRKFTNIHGESNADDDLLAATQSLSLDSATIPSHKFAYLQPTYADAKRKGKDKPEELFELLPGVRLLLSEWKLGTKPEDYVFKDWYASGSQDLSATEQDGAEVTGRRSKPFQIRSMQVPPVVMRQPPPVTSAPPTQSRPSSPSHQPRLWFGGSQMDAHMTQDSGLSQEQYPNTQPLPGRFGGQLNTNKTKPTKKRMGGF